MILAISATEKAICAFIQTACTHENLVLTLVFIKSLSSDFVSMFLLKMTWIWERNAVTKDRWPSEDCYYNSNLSHSTPLIKADILLMCSLWEALDVPGCLSSRKAIFFAFSHQCFPTSKFLTKRSHVYAKWHGRTSETVGFLGLTGSLFLVAPEKQKVNRDFLYYFINYLQCFYLQPQYHPNIHPAQPHWHPHTPVNVR